MPGLIVGRPITHGSPLSPYQNDRSAEEILKSQDTLLVQAPLDGMVADSLHAVSYPKCNTSLGPILPLSNGLLPNTLLVHNS